MTGSAMTGFRNISKAITAWNPTRRQTAAETQMRSPEQNGRIAHPKVGVQEGTGRMWIASVVERIYT